VVVSSAVEPPQVLAELEKLAKRLGVDVRHEPFAPAPPKNGGLCRLHGAPVVVMDERLPILDKIALLSEVLAAFDVDPLFVPPVLRARLERRKSGRRGMVVRPPLRPPVKARGTRP
jgi:hypothetical protein